MALNLQTNSVAEKFFEHFRAYFYSVYQPWISEADNLLENFREYFQSVYQPLEDRFIEDDEVKIVDPFVYCTCCK